MRYLTSSIVGLMAFLAGVTGPPGWSQDSDTVNQARLSAHQAEQLQSVGIPVAVPTVVPSGFEVINLEVVPLTPDDIYSGSYGIGYRQVASGRSAQACFAIEAAMGGFGGPVPEHQQPASLPPFAQPLEDFEDYTYQLFWSEGGRKLEDFPHPILFSDWIQGDRAYYRVISPVVDDTNCSRITPEKANQILESLRYLKKVSHPGGVASK